MHIKRGVLLLLDYHAYGYQSVPELNSVNLKGGLVVSDNLSCKLVLITTGQNYTVHLKEVRYQQITNYHADGH